MIDKNIFIKSMEEIEKAFLKDEKFNDALDEYDEGNYHCFVPSHILVEKAVVPFISESLGLDPTNENNIEFVKWFIWDCNFGRESENHKYKLGEEPSRVSLEVFNENNEKVIKEYVLRNSGDFYDFVELWLKGQNKVNGNEENNNKNNEKEKDNNV